jgi:hypothetical protein
MWKLALFGSVLLLWLITLSFILLCAHDLIGFLPGRERWFALTLNSVLLVLSVLSALRLGKCFRQFPKSTGAVCIGFFSILIVTGLWIPIVASVSGPPWQSRIIQIPYSADTPFMDSVWAWEIGGGEQK